MLLSSQAACSAQDAVCGCSPAEVLRAWRPSVTLSRPGLNAQRLCAPALVGSRHCLTRVHQTSQRSQVGWVSFEVCKHYDNHTEWAVDVPLHCVPEGSPYGWQLGKHATMLAAVT